MLNIFFSEFISFYVYENYIYMYVNVPVLCSACRGQKRMLDSLKLEIWTIVSFCEGAGIKTHVHYEK